jgi:hypothetical protein
MVVPTGFAVVDLRDARGVFDFTFTSHGTRKSADSAHSAPLRFSQQFLGQSASGSVPRSMAAQAESLTAKRAPPVSAAGMSKQDEADWNAVVSFYSAHFGLSGFSDKNPRGLVGGCAACRREC